MRDEPGWEEPAEAGVRLLVVVVQREVLRKREVEDETSSLTVLRDVSHAEVEDLASPRLP